MSSNMSFFFFTTQYKSQRTQISNTKVDESVDSGRTPILGVHSTFEEVVLVGRTHLVSLLRLHTPLKELVGVTV